MPFAQSLPWFGKSSQSPPYASTRKGFPSGPARSASFHSAWSAQSQIAPPVRQGAFQKPLPSSSQKVWKSPNVLPIACAYSLRKNALP